MGGSGHSLASAPTPSSLAGVGAVSLAGRAAAKAALVIGVVGLGGALTGYLAAGDARGAATGAAVHLSLLGLVAAIGGQAGGLAQSTGGRLAYGGLALSAGAGAGYLYWTRRSRR